MIVTMLSPWPVDLSLLVLLWGFGLMVEITVIRLSKGVLVKVYLHHQVIRICHQDITLFINKLMVIISNFFKAKLPYALRKIVLLSCLEILKDIRQIYVEV